MEMFYHVFLLVTIGKNEPNLPLCKKGKTYIAPLEIICSALKDNGSFNFFFFSIKLNLDQLSAFYEDNYLASI